MVIVMLRDKKQMIDHPHRHLEARVLKCLRKQCHIELLETPDHLHPGPAKIGENRV